jgi:hypothetical protein
VIRNWMLTKISPASGGESAASGSRKLVHHRLLPAAKAGQRDIVARY